MLQTTTDSAADMAVRKPHCFSGYEAIQTNLDVSGWRAVARQLGCGTLDVTCKSATHHRLSALEMHLTQAVEVSGVSAPGMITVLANAGPVPCWINARSVDSDRIVIVPPGFEIMSLFRAGSRVVAAQIPAAFGSKMPNSKVSCSVSRRELSNLVSSIGLFLDSDTKSRDRHNRALALLRDIHDLGRRDSESSVEKERCENRKRIILGASEYIGENLSRSIRVDELSGELTTSVSCLERTFKREVDLTPSQYILARRLVSANKKLKTAESEQVEKGYIARVAMDLGFNHLGRFSGAYRRHFGELPSETIAKP